jgi:hypothetical protein
MQQSVVLAPSQPTAGIRLRFRYSSDQSISQWGFYLDDVGLAYVPVANWYGTDGFDWSASNGLLEAAATAHVTLTVRPVGEPPVEMRLVLDTGWNLLSLPVVVQPAQPRVTLLCDDAGAPLCRGTPWGWDAATQRFLAIGQTAATPLAFWVYSAGAGPTRVFGGADMPDAPTAFRQGWNALAPARTAPLPCPRSRRATYRSVSTRNAPETSAAAGRPEPWGPR